jgi:hypothetical protein
MIIFIPSRGRANWYTRKTLSHIPLDFMHKTVVTVPHGEEDAYTKAAPRDALDKGLTILPMAYNRIADKRHKMALLAKDWLEDKMCILDDDLVFLIRRQVGHFSMRNQNHVDATNMFLYIDQLLDTYVHGAISPREGNNRAGDGNRFQLDVENTRAMRFHFFRTEQFLEVDHSRMQTMEDFHTTLSLLRMGYKNIVPYWYAQGQAKTQSPGGCSTWRTNELHEEQAKLLAELHPGFVRLRQKSNKTDNDGFGTRTEVTISWKSAWESSQ